MFFLKLSVNVHQQTHGSWPREGPICKDMTQRTSTSSLCFSGPGLGHVRTGSTVQTDPPPHSSQSQAAPLSCDPLPFTKQTGVLRPRPSDVGGGGVRGGEVVHAETNRLARGRRRVQEVAGEDLAAGLAEVLGQEGVEDGVDAGVAVGQAVGHNAEGEGGVVQREPAKLHPHGDDVVRHPAEGEGGDDQENRLGRLRREETSGHQTTISPPLSNGDEDGSET